MFVRTRKGTRRTAALPAKGLNSRSVPKCNSDAIAPCGSVLSPTGRLDQPAHVGIQSAIGGLEDDHSLNGALLGT